MLSSFTKYRLTRKTNCSTAEAISTNKVIKYRLAEILSSCGYFLKFCHIHSVEIGSNFVFCHSELVQFLKLSQNLPFALLMVTKIATLYDTIRNSVWESRLAYVLQRSVGANFLPDVGLFDTLRTYHPENT